MSSRSSALPPSKDLPSTPEKDEFPNGRAGPSSSSSVSGGGGIRSCSRTCATFMWRCLVAADGKHRQQNEHLCAFLEMEPPGADIPPPRVVDHKQEGEVSGAALNV